MSTPCALRLRRRLDRCELVSSHVGDAFSNPFDVLFDRYRHVRQYRGALRASDGEQVRVAGYSQAEVGLRAVLPLLRQRPSAAPLDAELLQGPGHRIEAGGDNNNVERVLLAACADPVRRDLLNWTIGARVYQQHILLVEGFEVVGVQRLALGAIGIALRN